MALKISKWTEEDKRDMMFTSDKIVAILESELHDPMKMAQVIDTIHTAIKERNAFKKIVTMSKDGLTINKLQVDRIARIIRGLEQSTHNIILFRNCPEVWMQYYMGKYFDKPTIVIAKLEDKPIYQIGEEVIWIKDFSESELAKAMEIVNKRIKNNVV